MTLKTDAASHDAHPQARGTRTNASEERLRNHQVLAVRILTAPASDKEALIDAAQREVQRWRQRSLDVDDYMERWARWLNVREFECVWQISSDAEDWSGAMQQRRPASAS